MIERFLSIHRTEQKQILETLIFASEQPISVHEILDLLERIDFSEIHSKNDVHCNIEINKHQDYIKQLIEEINQELVATNRPYLIISVANGYIFASRNEFGKFLGSLPQFKNKKKFSKAMLETLAIIAYKQPITKPEIEEIRGTNSNEIVNSLLERNLIKIVGRKDTIGRPFMYGTTIEFLKVFGINNLNELPNLDEIRALVEAQNKPEELTLKIDFDNEGS
ncbi:MAG: SMC-Scp complex subunit ScpB [Candidatus Kapaibacteriota bacterium]